MKNKINDILLNMQSGKICIGEAANELLILHSVSQTTKDKIKDWFKDLEKKSQSEMFEPCIPPPPPKKKTFLTMEELLNDAEKYSKEGEDELCKGQLDLLKIYIERNFG